MPFGTVRRPAPACGATRSRDESWTAAEAHSGWPRIGDGRGEDAHFVRRLPFRHARSAGTDSAAPALGAMGITRGISRSRSRSGIVDACSESSLLLVDDEEAFRKLTGKELEHAGYRVTTAGNLAEGRAALREQAFHLALLDVRM